MYGDFFMFKKTVLGLCCLLILSLMDISGQKLIFGGGDYYIFYSGNESSEAQMVTAQGFEALEVKASLQDIRGESAYFLNADCSKEILKSYEASIVFSETVSGIKNIYAYTKKIKNCIMLNGKKINIHIAVSADKTVAGSPIIFGGY